MKSGSKVVCVDAFIHNNEFIGIHFQNWVEQDAIYTIRDIFDNDDIAPTSITVEELVNKPIKMTLLGGIIREPAFLMSRFRELTEAELDALEEEAVNKKLKQNNLEIDRIKEDLEELINV